MMVYVIDRRVPNPPIPSRGLARLNRPRYTFEEGWRWVIEALPGHENAQLLIVNESETFRQIVGRIVEAAGTPWNIYMLRIISHGAPAYLELGTGITNTQVRNFRNLKHSMTPSRLNGRGVEIHGCNVAEGRRGRRFVQGIANLIDLPVVASPDTQYADNRFQFEGNSITRVEPSS